MSVTPRTVPTDQWVADGRALFGDSVLAWQFRCPSCGQRQSAQDFRALGLASQDDLNGMVGYTCIGYLRYHLANAVNVVPIGQPSQGAGCMYQGGDAGVTLPVFVQHGARPDGTPAGHLCFEFYQP